MPKKNGSSCLEASKHARLSASSEALSKAAKSGGKLEVKSADDKDVDTKALELDLQRALGLDVDIRHVNGKGGEVRIKYAQLEQLDEICRLLSRSRVIPGADQA